MIRGSTPYMGKLGWGDRKLNKCYQLYKQVGWVVSATERKVERGEAANQVIGG